MHLKMFMGKWLVAFMLTTCSPSVVTSSDIGFRRCGSVEITGDVSLPEVYRKCQVLEGHLRIQLAEDYKEERDLIADLSFPDLVQVTGYVMIYRVSPLKTLDSLLPRLSVIRGNELFHGYALIVYGNTFLEKVGLTNLTDILRGSVRIEKNWLLCPGLEHRWRKIMKATKSYNTRNERSKNEAAIVIKENYRYCFYHPCEEKRNCSVRENNDNNNKMCWAVGEGCYQSSKCHQECAGGCLKPNDPSACVACKQYLRNNTCVPSCSEFSSQNVAELGYLCIERDECKGKIEMMSEAGGGPRIPACVHCTGGNCSKGPCLGTNITSTNLGSSLKECTKVTGSLSITIAGGWNVTQQLEENLKNIREVTGYIRVYGSKTLFSLNFLRNIEVIGGQEKVHGQYALYVLENDNLQELWDFSQRSRKLTIGNGASMFFHYNPSLCPKLIYELANLSGVSISPSDVSNSTNGQNQPCYETDMNTSAWAGDEVGSIKVMWNHIYQGNDYRFVIGYYVFHREAAEDVNLFGGRDACNDEVLWERNLWNYEKESNRTVTIKGLKPYTRYALYVMAYYTNFEKKGSMSKILYVKTKPSEPSPVKGIEINRSPRNLSLKWDEPSKPNGEISFYEITYDEMKRPTYVRKHDENGCLPRGGDPHGVYTAADIVSQTTTNNTSINKTAADLSSSNNNNQTSSSSSSSSSQKCCSCSHQQQYLYSHMVKEDRQSVIAFENYLDSFLYSKMDYVNESHDSKAEEAMHSDRKKFSNTNDGNPKRRHRQRQKEIDPRGDNPQSSFREPSLTSYDGKETGKVATHTDKVNNLDPKDIHTQASIAGNYYTDVKNTFDQNRPNTSILGCGAGHLTNEKTYRICSPNKSITLDNLQYYTYYLVSIRVCQAPVNNQSLCSEWRKFPTHTLPDRKMNAITYFAVEEATEKEGGNKVKNPRKSKTSNDATSRIQDELLNTFSNTSEENNSTTTTTTGSAPSTNITNISKAVDTALPGSTLILKWEPPKHPNGPPLEYIIRIVDIDDGQGGKEKGIVCVPEEKARLAGYRHTIPGFEPGKYNISIRLRSQGDVGDPTTIQVEIPHSYLIWIVMGPLLSGILLGVCIIEAQVWFKKRRSDEAAEQPGNFVTWNGHYKESHGKQFEEKYKLKAEALQVNWEKQLGGGNFGMVYHGKLSDDSGKQIEVAVKTLNANSHFAEGECFRNEAFRMQNIKSNFVVELIGVVENKSSFYVVMGLMEKGDLKTYLLTDAGSTVKVEKMIQMAVEAADGMAYLASKKLVHRDLAARNCMLDANLTLKIGDFGLTRYLQTDYYKKEGRDCLPVRWMAPESLQQGKYSSRSDVWSYGVLLWEIFTRGRKPHEGHGNEQVCELVVRGVNLEKPSICPEFMYSTMLNCWKPRAKERPTFVQLVRLLLPRTSTEYLAYLEKVSFFHSSNCCDSESTEDNDEGFIASGSFDPSMEDEEEEDDGECRDDHCSFSNSLPPSPHLVDDDQVCLTPDDQYKRSSCASLSCISGSHTSQGIRLTPTRDTPYKPPHHRSSILVEMLLKHNS